MKVDNLKINHITRPMGYWYRTLTASWKVKEALGKFQQSAQIQVSSDEDFKEIIWDSGRDKNLRAQVQKFLFLSRHVPDITGK